MSLSYAELETEWQSMDHGPQGKGRVVLLVTRARASEMPSDRDKNSDPIHQQPSSVRFTIEEGLLGDRWTPSKDVQTQVSLVSLPVCRLVAGSEDRFHLFGNNLVVDLDLSATALPVGSRLRVGTGILEISPYPHVPCKRYEARFGSSARAWAEDEQHAERHLRGRYARVVQAGEVAIDDTIEIVR